jgi:choice-of-anchor B domain-containing protein
MRCLTYCLACAILLGVTANSLRAQTGAFGTGIVIGDGEVMVSEPANSFRPGIVYVYRKTGSSWREAAQLTPPDAERADRFGTALALAGSTLFVTQGSTVHVFLKSANGAWQSAGTVPAPEPVAGEAFGAAVAASGDWLLVGATRVPGSGRGGGAGGGRGGQADQAQSPGAVYAFRRGADGQWTQQAKLVASDAAPGDAFGQSIAIQSDRALIGAPGKNERAGVAYVFHLDRSGAWQQVAAIQARGVQANESFGGAVALDGDVALIGTPGSGGGYGAAYLFRRNAQTSEWVQQSRLVAFNGNAQDRFGDALALDGSDIWVGAPTGVPNGGTYVFRAEETEPAFSVAHIVRDTKADVRDRFGQRVALHGSIAAVTAGGADHGAGVVFLYERDAAGEWSEQARLASEPEGLEPLVGEERKCTEGRVGVFACGEAELLSFLPVHEIAVNPRGVRLNDLWGWTDPETGREYALVGRIEGTSFVDVTDPVNPIFVGELPKTPGAFDGTWRDIKVYNNHAFIVADGAGDHGMQVFDLTQLRNVSNAPVSFQPTAHYTRINSAHNIVINEESGFAYSVGGSAGGETCGGGLHMIDIRDPTNPTFAGCFADPQTGRRGTGYSHDAQCVIYKGPDHRYQGREICLGANENALSIADVTDKRNPTAVSRASYPNPAYTHQGWLTEDHRYYYMDDEGDEIEGTVERTRTLVWDLADLEDPKLALEFMGTTSASDHNLYIRGNLMFQSNYRAGLRIIDISNPLAPVEVGYFDTAPYLEDAPGFSGTWSNYPFFKSGAIAVTSVQEGLFLVKKRDQKTVF